tara:strand:- start:58 stop:405 length:348 start_codon:yes stop_codon:yes gene_type:complete
MTGFWGLKSKHHDKSMTMFVHIIKVIRTDGTEAFVRLSLEEAFKLLEYEKSGSRFVSSDYKMLPMPKFIEREIMQTITDCLEHRPVHQWQTEQTTPPSDPADLIAALSDIAAPPN